MIFKKKLHIDNNDTNNTIEILVQDWQKTKNKKILEEIINKHILLVHKIAKGYVSSDVEMHDLVAEGIIGLIHGMEKFQSHHNTKFSTYAYFWIKSKINSYVWKFRNLINISFSNKNSFIFTILNQIQNDKISYQEGVKLICEKENLSEENVKKTINILNYKINTLNQKMKLNDEKDLTWESLLENNDHEEMINNLEIKNISKLIKECMQSLSDKERIVINNRFLKENPDSLKELSILLNMSSEGIRHIEIRAIKKLKDLILMNTYNIENLHNLRIIFILCLIEDKL